MTLSIAPHPVWDGGSFVAAAPSYGGWSGPAPSSGGWSEFDIAQHDPKIAPTLAPHPVWEEQKC